MSPRVLASSSVVASVLTLSAVATPWLSTVATGQTPGIREVSASAHSVIPLQARLRFTTMIVLPEDDEILDVICGDKDFWIISATHNMAHVKPAKEGAATNLNLVTASGAVYSFLLNEKGGPQHAGSQGLRDGRSGLRRMGNRSTTPPPNSTASRPNCSRRGTRVEAERRRATDAIASYQQAYPSTLQFVYGTPKYEKPFLVRAIWHDGQFTYVKTDATELPALYEVKDGTPALVNFQVHSGTYVVPKVIERGYLALGKAQFVVRAARTLAMPETSTPSGTAPVSRSSPRAPRRPAAWPADVADGRRCGRHGGHHRVHRPFAAGAARHGGRDDAAGTQSRPAPRVPGSAARAR